MEGILSNRHPLFGLLLLWPFSLGISAPQEKSPSVQIELASVSKETWSIQYDLGKPASQMVFDRTPGDTRSQNWKTETGFQLVHLDNEDLVRRLDGKSFTRSIAGFNQVSADPEGISSFCSLQ
jgi:hypothetical protein